MHTAAASRRSGGPGCGADRIERVRAHAPNGVDHIVEVAFGGNGATDGELLTLGESIAPYATDVALPQIPFRPLLYKNVQVCFVGSDDVPAEAKVVSTREVNAALAAGWAGFEIAERLPLEEITRAHEFVEHPVQRGRVVVTL